jgi:hypothetical protein
MKAVRGEVRDVDFRRSKITNINSLTFNNFGATFQTNPVVRKTGLQFQFWDSANNRFTDYSKTDNDRIVEAIAKNQDQATLSSGNTITGLRGTVSVLIFKDRLTGILEKDRGTGELRNVIIKDDVPYFLYEVIPGSWNRFNEYVHGVLANALKRNLPSVSFRLGSTPGLSTVDFNGLTFRHPDTTKTVAIKRVEKCNAEFEYEEKQDFFKKFTNEISKLICSAIYRGNETTYFYLSETKSRYQITGLDRINEGKCAQLKLNSENEKPRQVRYAGLKGKIRILASKNNIFQELKCQNIKRREGALRANLRLRREPARGNKDT